MRIKAIVYDRVTVKCLSDPKKGGVYEEACISIGENLSGGIQIAEIETLGRRPRSALYARAALVELTPWFAKFTAFWWASTCDRRGKWHDAKMVPVEIVCEL